jgi:hypothetical protein
MADDGRDEIPEEELERIDRRAAEDIVSRHSNIGMVARARTIRRLVAALRRDRMGSGPNDGVERAIAGALRAAIHDHGPVTPEAIGSAVKRIMGNLRKTSP